MTTGWVEHMRDDFLVRAFVFVLVMIIVMIILRELSCWYWKINEIVRLLTGIRSDLAALNITGGLGKSLPTDDQLEMRKHNMKAAQSAVASLPAEDLEYCPYCDTKSSIKSRNCEACGK